MSEKIQFGEWYSTTYFNLKDFPLNLIILLGNDARFCENKAKVTNRGLVDYYNCLIDVFDYDFFLIEALNDAEATDDFNVLSLFCKSLKN